MFCARAACVRQAPARGREEGCPKRRLTRRRILPEKVCQVRIRSAPFTQTVSEETCQKNSKEQRISAIYACRHAPNHGENQNKTKWRNCSGRCQTQTRARVKQQCARGNARYYQHICVRGYYAYKTVTGDIEYIQHGSIYAIQSLNGRYGGKKKSRKIHTTRRVMAPRRDVNGMPRRSRLSPQKRRMRTRMFTLTPISAVRQRASTH